MQIKWINNKRTAEVSLFCMMLFAACNDEQGQPLAGSARDTIIETMPLIAEQPPAETKDTLPAYIINTGATSPAELVEFAKTLIGIPYLYASTDPAKGFDCSGFITYVFKHFNITVPRSSVDFTSVGREIQESEARKGDLILFTGTDSTIRVVGHMGIIIDNEDNLLEFIHSTSGKQKGVVVTPLKDYYRSRFVKIIRVFPG